MHNLEKLKPLALLLLRWGLGIIFIFHGYPKLFTETAHFRQMFVQMGFPPYFVYIAGALEFFGGCLLIVGLFTRIAALLLAGEMAVAIFKVHLGQGIYAVHAYEFPLACCLGSFALATLGPGVISLDAAVFKGRA
jgi:putative oxidoreductase